MCLLFYVNAFEYWNLTFIYHIESINFIRTIMQTNFESDIKGNMYTSNDIMNLSVDLRFIRDIIIYQNYLSKGKNSY